MAVSKRLRFEVIRRDNFACRYCGKKAAETELTVDHVVPVALGGEDVAENLVAACADCNAGKAATGPGEEIVGDVTQDALRWSRALEKAGEIHAAQQKERETFTKSVDAAWSVWHLEGEPNEPIPRPSDWEQSVGQFFDAGLDIETAQRMVRVTMNKAQLYNERAWRYFCGCCWNVIRERQEIARDLIEKDDGGR